MRAFWFSCCAALGLLVSPAAHASPLLLTWTAPSACPSESSVQDAVAFAIGETPQGVEPIRASVTVVERDALWRASIVSETRNGSGSRELEGASCQEVTAAAVVVLSLLVRENAELGSSGSATPGTSSNVGTSSDAAATESTVASAPPNPDDNAPTSSLEETSSSRFGPDSELGPDSEGNAPEPNNAQAVATQPAAPLAAKRATPVAILPERFLTRAAASITLRNALPLEGGGQVAIARYEDAWGAEFSVGARTPLATVTAEQDVAVDLTSIDLTLAPCVRWAAEVSLAVCAGARLEWLLASAPRVAEPRSDSAALWGGVLNVQLRVPQASRLRLFSAAEAHLRFRKVHLDVEPFGRVLDVPALGLSFLLGPELAF